ncbi:MAG: glucose-1-phosphate adenylyltransferase subunit GlgD [Oscillospiraceae bacterium]|jgi:glucose-1-phosphate adenylyltransferase|nr:glucose-1-phosphate adenylyltransferase subunit GlgD [Oscillospiraceae bacterium]
MIANSVLGVIFSNMHEEKVRELTETRTMGSVPFGGRYRLIDFALSNMVNSGINKVGVITKSNYQSLMDHLGSGKAWDLSRKREGLYILPPFSSGASDHNSRLDSLASVMNFLSHSNEKYVLMTDSDYVCNIDLRQMMQAHIQSGADVTLAYHYGHIPEHFAEPISYEIDPDGMIRGALVQPKVDGACNYGLPMLLMDRELMMKLVSDCVSRNLYSFQRDFIQRNIPNYHFHGYEFKGFICSICSMNDYFESNMALMQPKVRSELFNPNRPIYTKVRDDMPTRYGLGSEVSNSLIADGCVIEGAVENCVLFRGVHIGKNSKVTNCVIMQDSMIGQNCKLDYVIMDKDVTIKDDRSLMGFQSYPVFISKGSVV